MSPVSTRRTRHWSGTHPIHTRTPDLPLAVTAAQAPRLRGFPLAGSVFVRPGVSGEVYNVTGARVYAGDVVISRLTMRSDQKSFDDMLSSAEHAEAYIDD